MRLLAERLPQISTKVFDILNPNREPQQPFGDPGVRLNRVAMLDKAFHTAKRRSAVEKLQPPCRFQRRSRPAFDDK